MVAKLNTAVLGATGYSGLELARLLGRHPRTDAPVLMRRSAETDDSAARLPQVSAMAMAIAGFVRRDESSHFPGPSWKNTAWNCCSWQHPTPCLANLFPKRLRADTRGLRIVDLSGAWRLKQEQHRAVYGFKDANTQTATELTERAVYGLPELKPNADQIRTAALVANPGCYATSVILALAPLLSAEIVDCDRGIISDSKSGVSGAGKEPTARTHFVSVADNFSAYSVFGHRHTGEILEQLALNSAS